MTKITLDRAVVEQALHVATGAGYPVALIAALKDALAEPITEDSSAVEPVAWGCFKDGELQSELIGTKTDVDFWVASDEPHMQGMVSGPLYTAPPQRPAEPVQEPVQDTGVKLKPVFYAPRRLDDEDIEAIVGKPVQEPYAWMAVGGTVWRHKSSQDDVPLYTSPQPQQTEPSQDTPPQHEYEVTANDDGTFSVGLPDGEELRIIPPQRKPMNEFDALRLITESIGRLQSAGPVEGLIGIIRAVERAHGIT